jgi:hypothetical protein
MGILIKEIILKVKNKDKENLYGEMEIHIMDNFIKILCKDRALLFQSLVKFTKELFTKEKGKEKDNK